MKNKTIFITGISTEVGKTLVSSIVVEALKSDYWKPIQSGDLSFSDTDKVKSLISTSQTVFHPESYRLNTPMSPHASAVIDKVQIELQKIIRPKTQNHLVIEGAGGLLVPLNTTDTICDLISKDDCILLISRNYLGSINHTLLSLEHLKIRGFKKVGIIFSGEKNESTESIILEKTAAFLVGRIPEIEVSKQTVKMEAQKIKTSLLEFIS